MASTANKQKRQLESLCNQGTAKKMFGLHKVLEKRALDNTPISVSLVGVGTMGTVFAQSLSMTTGIDLCIICDLRTEEAIKVFESTGAPSSKIEVCKSVDEANAAIKCGKKVVTSDISVATSAEQVEAVCESTGVPAVYAQTGISAIQNRKHFITMNVEGDVCVGHLMNNWAKQAGVVYSGIYGDEPGSAMLQHDEAKLIGLDVIAVGRTDMGGSNLCWNKESIKPEMERLGICYNNTAIFASFCDGSKTNEECCAIANATGLPPDIRGMHGPKFNDWNEIATRSPGVFRTKEEGGILGMRGVTDYIANDIIKAEPWHPFFIWTFAVVKARTQGQTEWIVREGGIVEGEYGLLYGPYHRGSAQAPVTVAVAVVDKRPVIAPLEGSKRTADCITLAKKDLSAGEVIDEIGGFCTVGRIEKASITRAGRLLPFALAKGTVVKRDIPMGTWLTYDDVEFAGEPSLLLNLRRVQDAMFGDLW